MLCILRKSKYNNHFTNILVRTQGRCTDPTFLRNAVTTFVISIAYTDLHQTHYERIKVFFLYKWTHLQIKLEWIQYITGIWILYSLSTFHLFPIDNIRKFLQQPSKSLLGYIDHLISHYYRPIFYTFRTQAFFSNDATHYEVGFKVTILSFIKIWKISY